MDPFSLILSLLVGTGASVAGGIMQNKANKEAAGKAEALTNRQLDMQADRDRFDQKIGKANLKLAKEQAQLAKDRFGLESMTTGYGINKDMLSRVTELLNTNNDLKDRVLSRWSM